MDATAYNSIAGILTLAVLYGLHLMSSVKTAVRGNLVCALAMSAGIMMTMYKDHAFASPVLCTAIAVGMVFGLFLSNTVKMIQMPQLVAFLHGLGGGTAAFVGLVILLDIGVANAFERVSACLALAAGMITIAGSFVAAGKLHQLLPQKPLILPGHGILANAILAVMGAAFVMHAFALDTLALFAVFLLFTAGLAFGIVFTMRVGGADMPITISLLNSLGGTSSAIAGFAVGDPLLIAIGGIIGSSGFMLTRIMCRAMNRKLVSILLGESSVALGAQDPAASVSSAPIAPKPADGENKAASWLTCAGKVIIVPGYGMALAQAQHRIKQLADMLKGRGASVSYAIHPVAGRMPGHMNVLLAEASVEYEQLLEMDAANPLFAEADLVLVVGANDVVNPAAMEAKDTPIYGMPILRVDEAKRVIICNYDDKPGYAGVENSLYRRDGVILIQGDAASVLERLIAML
ncbi:MAG: NAD(P)(+) transhydrogenase (Re/Si-specific) subunit beta [Deltaproteobacteria bacterium]|jgi:NAD(P) transhydrogenase subunit beta|nr:NAD(P)(+) transhydrogenase (Re/Si-specific) subunit beta [Deltaproteobacteria bacterium]